MSRLNNTLDKVIVSETILECEAVMLHGQKSKIGEVFAQV